jgi:glycosyltransferase involved in cell wall biosynthesis
VVTLVDSLGSGGAERIVLELATGFDPARVESIVCISREYDEVDAAWVQAKTRLRESGVRIVQLRRRNRVALWAWRPLVSLLRTEQVDVLHAHMFGSNVWGALVGSLARVPVVVAHDHGWVGPRSTAQMFLDREVVARGSDTIVAVSRHTREQLIERERIAPEKVVFIPNGIPQSPPPSGASVRGELGLGEATPVVGTVGLLRAQKALHVLIEAVAMVIAREFPDLILVIAGPGPERPRLERRIAELGIADHVRFLGLRTDVPDVIAAFNVAASSSDFEGSPLAIMEFMAGGRPIVATSVGGVPDLIEDGVHGRLVPPGSPEALAQAIAELLRDPARAAQMGQRARERRESEFGVGAMVARIEALYRQLLASPATTGRGGRRRGRGRRRGGERRRGRPQTEPTRARDEASAQP